MALSPRSPSWENVKNLAEITYIAPNFLTELRPLTVGDGATGASGSELEGMLLPRSQLSYVYGCGGAGLVGKSGVQFKRPCGHPRADVKEQVKMFFWDGPELCVV